MKQLEFEVKHRWTLHFTHTTLWTPEHPGFLHSPLSSVKICRWLSASFRRSATGSTAVGPLFFFSSDFLSSEDEQGHAVFLTSPVSCLHKQPAIQALNFSRLSWSLFILQAVQSLLYSSQVLTTDRYVRKMEHQAVISLIRTNARPI
jgi:hypothetical protein